MLFITVHSLDVQVDCSGPAVSPPSAEPSAPTSSTKQGQLALPPPLLPQRPPCPPSPVSDLTALWNFHVFLPAETIRNLSHIDLTLSMAVFS